MLEETLRYMGIAFASSAILIVLSKIILQHLIRRPADYYLASEYRQEEMMLNAAGISINDELVTNPEGEATEEHIHVEPQISVEEAIEMHLIEEDRIPEQLIHPEQSEAVPEEPEESAKDETVTAGEEPVSVKPQKSSKAPAKRKAPEKGKTPAKRKPSMRMKRDELIAAAVSMGIEVPEKAIKKEILALINEKMGD